jgi:hypothetical protein
VHGIAADGRGNLWVTERDSDKIARVRVPVPLHVTKSGHGAGKVTSTPAGIACGASCTTTFRGGTMITLTARARTGSTFVRWAGACTGTRRTCQVLVNAAKTARATFARKS